MRVARVPIHTGMVGHLAAFSEPVTGPVDQRLGHQSMGAHIVKGAARIAGTDGTKGE